MKHRLFTLISVLILCFTVGITAHAQDEAGDLFGRVNSLRASLGRAGYTSNGALAAAAQSQAAWIVETGSVAHTRPDGSGPRTRAANAGYPSQQVSENIYGGTNAGVNDAWTFWMNSGVHYNSIVNTNYTEMGVGVAHGAWGAAYVLVFGNPTGSWSVPAAAGNTGGGNNSSGGGNNAPANNAPPSFVLGLDENGNIMHEVQPGDTLGDIALIYGYTWDDLPELMELNHLTNVRDLVVGSVFLVPSQVNYNASDGGAAGASEAPAPENVAFPTNTFTPLPATITPFIASGGNGSIPSPIPTLNFPTLDPTYEMQPGTPITGNVIPATIIVPPDAPTLDPTYEMSADLITPPPTPTPTNVNADAAALPTIDPTQIAALPTIEGTSVAILPTAVSTGITQTTVNSTLPMWVMIALGLQVIVIIGAGLEFARRSLALRGGGSKTTRDHYFKGRRRR